MRIISTVIVCGLTVEGMSQSRNFLYVSVGTFWRHLVTQYNRSLRTYNTSTLQTGLQFYRIRRSDVLFCLGHNLAILITHQVPQVCSFMTVWGCHVCPVGTFTFDTEETELGLNISSCTPV